MLKNMYYLPSYGKKTLLKCCLQTCFGILTLKKEDYYKVFSQCGDVMSSAFIIKQQLKVPNVGSERFLEKCVNVSSTCIVCLKINTMLICRCDNGYVSRSQH